TDKRAEVYVQGSTNTDHSDNGFGLPQSIATIIFNAFTVLRCVTPVAAAAASDMALGRYNTLLAALCFYTVGALAMVLSALPQVAGGRFQIVSFIVALILLGIGAGGVKATIGAIVGDQLTTIYPPDAVSRPPTGEDVGSVGRSAAMRRLFNVQFWVTNFGTISIVVVPIVHANFSFWAAYVLCLASIISATALTVLARNFIAGIHPNTNGFIVVHKVVTKAVPHSYRRSLQILRNGFSLKRAQQSHGWSDSTMHEMKRCKLAINLLLFGFPPMWLCTSQLFSNLVSQAAQMETHGMPNEIIPFFNSVACMLLIPATQLLSKLPVPPRWTPGPITRISVGFAISALGFGWTAGLQKLIFLAGPCYERPRQCPESLNGATPNNISFFLQIPTHVAIALGEIFSIVTGLAYSYDLAPADMKAMVQAAYSLGSGIGSLASIACSPLAQDSLLITLYSLLASIMMTSAVGVWYFLRQHNDKEL
ncbi:hypothetical protein GQ53DRAFT_851491, partial [Thozetella sp. PMI_491]